MERVFTFHAGGLRKMKGNVKEMSAGSFIVAARAMFERGEISLEQYAQTLRRAALGGKGNESNKN